MEKMSSITFPDGSSYEVVDDTSRKNIDELNSSLDATNEELAKVKSAVGFTKKNLLNNINITSAKTSNGVTCTPNSDGSFTLTGIPTATTFFNINFVDTNTNAFSNGKYKLSGSKSGVSLQLIVDSGEGGFDKDGQGLDFEIQNTTNNWIRIFVSSTANLGSGVTIYPMIRYASIKDDTFESYAPDVNTLLTWTKQTFTFGSGVTGNFEFYTNGNGQIKYTMDSLKLNASKNAGAYTLIGNLTGVNKVCLIPVMILNTGGVPIGTGQIIVKVGGACWLYNNQAIATTDVLRTGNLIS